MAEREITVGSPFGTKQSRIIMPIEGGSINGPTISGVIEHLSGADWVTAIEGTDVSLSSHHDFPSQTPG